MKLKDAREHYYTFSGSLSAVTRQLCFAGIAVVWIFSVDGGNGNHFLPKDLFVPLAFFIAGLASDLLQYMVSSASWGIYHRVKEKSGIGEDADFGAPCKINWAPNVFFWGKAVFTIIGYALLLNLVSPFILDSAYNLQD